MKIEAGKKYLTRNGEVVEILRDDLKGDYPIAGVMTLSDGSQTVESWTYSGEYHIGGETDAADLIKEIKPKKTVDLWVNVYSSSPLAYYHRTKEHADDHAEDHRIARLHIIHEYEEGQFDE